MHQLVIKEGSVLLMHGVTMKFLKSVLVSSVGSFFPYGNDARSHEPEEIRTSCYDLKN